MTTTISLNLQPIIYKTKLLLKCPANEILVGGPQPFHSKVLTPTGFKLISEIELEDKVLTPSGKTTVVTAIPYVGFDFCYRITMSDQTVVDCSENHFFPIRHKQKEYKKTKVKDILNYNEKYKKMNQYVYGLDIIKDAGYKHKNLYIDPYILGVLIADGSISQKCISFTKYDHLDSEVIENVRERLQEGYYIRNKYGKQHFITKGGPRNGYKDELVRLGLYGHITYNKFIPREYIESSMKQRIELLRGLLDCDGMIRRKKDKRYNRNKLTQEIVYSTTSEQLSKDVQELVRSLGGTANITSSTDGNKNHRRRYNININIDENPFKLTRKANLYEKQRYTRRIVDIKPIGILPCRCIEVEDESHMYITSDYIPTFNSLAGAKSTSLVIDAGVFALKYPGANVALIRQSFTELQNSIINKFTEIFPQEIYEYKSSYRKGYFSNGSIINFGYIETDSDLYRHQSVEYQYLGIDEATHNTEYQHRTIKRRVRSALPGVPTRIVYAANPGGASHKYFYDRFMLNKEPYKIYPTIETENVDNPRTQCFIKSGLIDNPYVFENDPNYKYMLQEMTEHDKEMYLFGNWEVNAGQFFKEWSEATHVIESYAIQDDDQLFLTCDYGTAKPSGVLWCALTRTGRIVAYRELYTMRANEPDTGLNIPAHTLAKMILEQTPQEEIHRIKHMVLDNACWSNLGHGKTIYHLMFEVLPFPIIKTNKERISGWAHMRYYLEAKDKDDKPYFQCTKSCVNLIRTMPLQVHHRTIENDCDDRVENHICEAARYLLILRPKPRNYDRVFIPKPDMDF